MKTKLLTASLLLMTINSSTSAMYIPDLFGAMIEGEQQARYANQRDAYYYAQLNRPRLYLAVYNEGFFGVKAKKNLSISLKKGDNLCWTVAPLRNGYTFYSSELITMPYKGKFTGRSPNKSTQKTTSNVKVSSNSVGFTKQIISTGNQIYSCWVFNTKSTPKGQYFITITVGDEKFGTRAFNIID